MDSTLVTKKCQACETATGKLSPNYIADLIEQVPGWKLAADGVSDLSRTFKFQNYYEAMAFVNATAWISHREDHHPDIELGYNSVSLRYSTHSLGGLTENDFICAAKVNALLTI